ncbi:MAG: UDP-2,3-diacylglucosamine diphosphatase [Gammaproteobacteria bacterium]|nr:UDP-2,3-diacylglucosamine diphosphatase [Gammaproteobacteria bacterium]MBI5615541.1 UDP-2,3-diacylglucosamine diphosphatase [Gammaproteobacteria bacterium]
MATLFLSDLHLSAVRPDKLGLFFAVLAAAPYKVATVYVLGDLFEFWLGDDDDTPEYAEVVRRLGALTRQGVALKVTPGNRDFLLGERFAAATGAEILPDYHVAELDGERHLLAHGDLLCTRDLNYQAFRRYVWDPQNRRTYLALPLAARRQIAADTRNGTVSSMLTKDENIMDVDEDTVQAVMREHGVRRFVHGHTHRPAIHDFDLDGAPARRFVLGEWYGGSVLGLHAGGELRLLSAEEFIAAPA